mmetsp:Transcript_9709/g.39995  ORF Transcript_9709/g.39995 Transcript_9709/m.39995 type:complete len:233 (+) Transcript_9709:1402-2100(+)
MASAISNASSLHFEAATSVASPSNAYRAGRRRAAAECCAMAREPSSNAACAAHAHSLAGSSTWPIACSTMRRRPASGATRCGCVPSALTHIVLTAPGAKSTSIGVAFTASSRRCSKASTILAPWRAPSWSPAESIEAYARHACAATACGGRRIPLELLASAALPVPWLGTCAPASALRAAAAPELRPCCKASGMPPPICSSSSSCSRISVSRSVSTACSSSAWVWLRRGARR